MYGWIEETRECLLECAAAMGRDRCFSDGGVVTSDAALEGGRSDGGDAADVAQPDVRCAAGEAACGGRCVSTADDPLNCGACARACTPPAGATATCVMGVCDFRCVAGRHACGTSCLPDDSPSSCGTRCTPCPEPIGARATCVMGACGSECLAGYERNGDGCEIAVPRPVFPPGTSTVTSRRPTLRWALAMGATGAQIELCRDRACSMVIERIDATGDNARPGADLPASRVVFWRMRGRVGAMTGSRLSPTWQFRTGARSAPVDTAFGVEGDYNGDGFTDLAVGAPGANSGAGRVSVYNGSATGLSATPSRVLDGAEAFEGFGRSMAAVGDINGDGFGDLAVGSPFGSSGGRAVGVVRVFYGSASGIGPVADQTIVRTDMTTEASNVLAAIGDADRDGFADVAIGFVRGVGVTGQPSIAFHRGSRAGLESVPSLEYRGTTFSGEPSLNAVGAGDVNGDQFADLLIRFRDGSGAGVAVLNGSPAGIVLATRRILADGDTRVRRGLLTGAVDFDGDGLADVAIGRPFESPGGVAGAGEVRVYAGSSAGINGTAYLVLRGTRGGQALGSSVASVGDVDADGFGDLAVATVSEPEFAGRVELFRGSPTGVGATSALLRFGLLPGDQFGTELRYVGDINGDGTSDCAVGSLGAQSGTAVQPGRATIAFGPAWMTREILGAADRDQFGATFASRTQSRALSRAATMCFDVALTNAQRPRARRGD